MGGDAKLQLPLEGLAGPADLPRALFLREVLERGHAVVASAHAEREGQELETEEMLAVGEFLQLSLDRKGVREALLRAGGEHPVLLRRSFGAINVSVATAEPASARSLAESIAADMRVEPKPRDPRVPVAFWSGAGDGFLGEARPRWRRLALPSFGEIADNYSAPVRARLAALFTHSSGERLPGRLALWHGSPGTGKTWALRALGREWSEWCDLHYVTDPERMLGGDTSYMLSVLAGASDPEPLDEELGEPSRRGERGERWRLIVLEDAGELLGIAAPSEVGRGFARLLNITDGLLGQGSRALVLVTTNEPLGRLHPAALRPGRAMATVEFTPLTAVEAGDWLAARGCDAARDSPATIAELHAELAGRAGGSPAAPAQVGFG